MSFPCLAQTPGTEKWSFATGDKIWTSSPAVGGDGVIYVGSRDDNLYAVNPDGTERWSFTAGSFISPSPAIGPDGVIYAGSNDSNLYAVNPDGTQKWAFDTGSVVTSSPAIGPDGVIYVGSWSKYLYAVNPDGTEKWRFKADAYFFYSSPAIGPDGTIYVGSWDDNLYAIHPDGTQKWAFTTGDNVDSSPAIGADGVIHVGSWDDNLYAIHPDGTQKWVFTTGDNVNSSPAIDANGVIYVGSDDHKLYAIHPDGTQKWAFTTGGDVSSSPAIGADGVIYVGSDADKLYAINPDGTEKWSFRAGSDMVSSPAIGPDGVIYVGSDDRKLYAIYSDSPGLANAPWPKFHQNNRNTSNSEPALGVVDNDPDVFRFFTPGAAVTKPFSAINPTVYAITINASTFSDPDFTLENSLPITLPPGAVDTLTATLTPDGSGFHQTTWGIDYEIDGESKSASMEIFLGLFSDDKGESAYTARRALDAYTLCKAADADSVATKNNLGVLHRLLGNASAAEAYLLEALAGGMSDSHGYAGIKMNMGVVESDKGASESADAYYDLAYTDVFDAESQSAIAPQIYYNKAWEAYNISELSAALADVDKTIGHAMTNTFLMAKAHILRGAISHARGDAAAAEADFKQAFALDPDGPMGAMARSNLTPAGCVPVNADLALETRVELGGLKYQFTLKHAVVAADPAGLYWKLDMATLQLLSASAEGCAQFGENYSLPVCAEYYGNVFNFTLIFARNPDDPGGLYWKAAPGN
ncbi:MAG: PQQ-binding-like beta-propeller repeat protein [Desulfobacterales bacterium]|nr:PQQ-binding-like beta-propeller repeat protein [Desulfobacterales bacterium]